MGRENRHLNPNEAVRHGVSRRRGLSAVKWNDKPGMEFRDVEGFLRTNHRGVVTTRQADGAAHTSIVVCGAYQGNAAFVVVRGRSTKVRNLRRDPACTVLAVTDDWRAFVTVEGKATLFDASNTEAEELRVLLREVYRACGDKDHPTGRSMTRRWWTSGPLSCW